MVYSLQGRRGHTRSCGSSPTLRARRRRHKTPRGGSARVAPAPDPAGSETLTRRRAFGRRVRNPEAQALAGARPRVAAPHGKIPITMSEESSRSVDDLTRHPGGTVSV